MADPSTFLSNKRYAVVTGGNKGIGLEICRQLASKGITVVLTARNESRGIESLNNLKASGVNPDHLVFHQLDVTDPTSFSSLLDFITTKFGKLDILVNNAGIVGAIVNYEALGLPDKWDQANYNEIMTQTYELAQDCVQTNYYGVKRTVEALLPLLQLSDSPRIVNVSSYLGKLMHIPSERIRGILDDVEKLTEEKVDELLNQFLTDLKNNCLKSKGWPEFTAAYKMSKAALNAYTRLLAKKYQSININCICPGYVKTDLNDNMGNLSVEEGAASPVNLALKPHGSPSGLFYMRYEVSSFE